MCEELAVTVEEDEAFEALARRNDELQREKLDRLEELQHQEWKIDKLREALVNLLSEAEEFAKAIPPYGNSEALINARRIIEQTKSEGE